MQLVAEQCGRHSPRRGAVGRIRRAGCYCVLLERCPGKGQTILNFSSLQQCKSLAIVAQQIMMTSLMSNAL